MKKILVLLMTAMLALVLVTAGCGGNEEKAGSEKVLRVGTEPSFAPFEFQTEDGGELTGFDMDLIRAIGQKLGYKVEISAMGFDALIPALQADNIDVAMAGMTITEERKQQVVFSDPYYKSGLLVMVPKDNNDIKSIDDLKGKRIAVQIGTTGAFRAEKVEGAKVIAFNDNGSAVLEMKNGAADVVINDAPVLRYFLTQGGSEYAKTVGEVLSAEDYGIAVKKGNDKLAADINKAMKELKDSGEFDKIYNKWFGEAK